MDRQVQQRPLPAPGWGTGTHSPSTRTSLADQGGRRREDDPREWRRVRAGTGTSRTCRFAVPTRATYNRNQRSVTVTHDAITGNGQVRAAGDDTRSGNRSSKLGDVLTLFVNDRHVSFDLAVLAMGSSADATTALEMFECCSRAAGHVEGEIDSRVTAFCDTLAPGFALDDPSSAWAMTPVWASIM